MEPTLWKEISPLSSPNLETVTKNNQNKNSIKSLNGLEYIWKFHDPNGHENYHVGEAATISKPLDERVVEFLETLISSGCKRMKELQCLCKKTRKKTRISQNEIQTKQQQQKKKKNKNLSNSVKTELIRQVSYICEKSSYSQRFIEPSNLCLLIMVVPICSVRTL